MLDLQEKKVIKSQDLNPGLSAKKIKRIQADAINNDIDDAEASALAQFIGSNYSEIKNAALFGQSTELFGDHVVGVKRALAKLPSPTLDDMNTTLEQQYRKYKLKESDSLNRWITISKSNMDQFVEKYQTALANSSAVVEEYPVSTTMFKSASELGFFSSRANVTYRIKPKYDGTTSSRLVDKYKNGNIEGELLYPPMSQFKVSKLTYDKSTGSALIEMEEL